jgi:hypothetical protein
VERPEELLFWPGLWSLLSSGGRGNLLKWHSVPFPSTAASKEPDIPTLHATRSSLEASVRKTGKVWKGVCWESLWCSIYIYIHNIIKLFHTVPIDSCITRTWKAFSWKKSENDVGSSSASNYSEPSFQWFSTVPSIQARFILPNTTFLCSRACCMKNVD